MKHKVKPIQRAEIRERVENKMRARGAVLFLGLLFAGTTGLLLAALPDLWPARFDVDSLDRLYLAAVPYTILGMTFVIRFVRYTFDYGARYEKHLDETEAMINRQLQLSRKDEWEEQEELIRIRQADKLKHRRLLMQHIALFFVLMGPLTLMRWADSNVNGWDLLESMTTYLYLAGIWGIGLVAHILRQVFDYGSVSARRQAWIDAEVAREIAKIDSGEDQRSAGMTKAARGGASRSAHDDVAPVSLTAGDEQARNHVRG